MARHKASSVSWEQVEVLGKKGLFNDLRIDRKSIPEGYFMYEIRHSDEDWGEPIEICLGVLVNFFGTLLMREPLELLPSETTDNAYLEIGPDDWGYTDEPNVYFKD